MMKTMFCTILLILTFPLAQFNFSKIMMLSADPVISELWWPNVGQMLILNPYQTLGEALSGIDNGLLANYGRFFDGES